ncbi:MAG: hypothetical protein J6I73_05115 [Treponema sp.]|nr:hypothetical protein [Treponema sp.]
MQCSNKLITFAIISGLTFIISSCYTPSPLYGTWVDNSGKAQIIFTSDGSFNASIVSSTGETVTYSGTWSVMNNVLHIKKNTGSSFVTEWDIRASNLYLTWTYDNSEKKALTLFQISK